MPVTVNKKDRYFTIKNTYNTKNNHTFALTNKHVKVCVL